MACSLLAQRVSEHSKYSSQQCTPTATHTTSPGPACYRKGGELAITDANLVLGRLIPSQFPSIFGPNANEPLDVSASVKRFDELTKEINATRKGEKPYSIQEVAAGFVRIANEGMSRPMRNVTEQKGYAMSSHDLCCFGG